MKSAARDIGRILWYLSALCILMLLLFPAKAFSLLYGDIPVIGDISPDQIITDSTSATLYASGVTDNDRIARVWAIIQLPNDTPGVETDFQESYTLEFKKTAGEENRYEGTFDGFDAIGTYYIRIYARDWLGKTSKPGLTTVAAHKPLRSLVIILAGTSGDENEQIAIEKSAKLAWDTLIHKGFSENDLYLLSSSDIPGVNISPVSATPGNLNYAINTWAKENGRELLLYMVGDGSTREFKMDDSHVLSAVDLNSWLDNLQAYLTGQVAVITDAPYSWAYLSALQPQTNTDRILISGTGLNQAANFFSQNAFVFSMFFWNSVFSGANMSDAFVQAQHVLTWTEFRQKPHIDANGNGVPDELADHELSEDFNIGSTVDFPGTSPAIGSVGGIEKSADMHINIWASDVSSSGNIDQVLAIVVPPPFGNQKQEKIPLSTIDMPWNAANNRYEAEYNLLDSTGIYRFAIYAIDEYNRVSQPMETSVTHVSTLKDIYENDDTWEAANFILLSSAEFKDSGFDIQDHSQLHNFHTETDEDWVKFHAQKDGIYHIRVKDVGDKNDPILRIYKSDGQTLIDELEGKTNKFIDDAFTGDNEDFDWTCPADGIYYAMIRQWQPEDYPNEADLCHPSSGEGTEYRLVFFIPAMSFDSYIWGEIMPHDANAQITSDAGSLALQEPTGYFGMPHIAGTFTLTATASGYKQYDKIIAVPEILSTQIDAIILTEDTSIPTADFSGSPVSGNAPLTTQFTDESKKVVTSWLWDFGDDTPNSEEQNPAHKYQNSGTYTVKLTATGHGEDTKVRIEYIQVNPPPPIAHFTADQTTGIAPLNVKFSDQSTGGPTS